MPTTQFVGRQSRYGIKLSLTLRTKRSSSRCCYTITMCSATKMTIRRNFAVASHLARPTPPHRRADFHFSSIILSRRVR